MQDGYYIVSAICIGFGILSVVFFLIPTAKKLQGVSPSSLLRRQSSDACCRRAYEQVENILVTPWSTVTSMDIVKVVVLYRSIDVACVARHNCVVFLSRAQGHCGALDNVFWNVYKKRRILRVWMGARGTGPEVAGRGADCQL